MEKLHSQMDRDCQEYHETKIVPLFAELSQFREHYLAQLLTLSLKQEVLLLNQQKLEANVKMQDDVINATPTKKPRAKRSPSTATAPHGK
jgi:hypothetical protein